MPCSALTGTQRKSRCTLGARRRWAKSQASPWAAAEPGGGRAETPSKFRITQKDHRKAGSEPELWHKDFEGEFDRDAALSSTVSTWHEKWHIGRGRELEHRPGAAAWDGQCPNPYGTERPLRPRGHLIAPGLRGNLTPGHAKAGGKLETQVFFLDPSRAPSATLAKLLTLSQQQNSINDTVLLCRDVLKTNLCFPGERD